MNLEHLERFIALATNKNDQGQKDINIAHVAEKLYTTAPHLSNQIKKLETELNTKLFKRKPQLELTPIGEILLIEAQNLLVQVERIKQLTNQFEQGEIGELKIAINTSISNGLLPEILRDFRQKFPKIKLILQEMTFVESRQRLYNNTIDVDFENWYNIQDMIEDPHHVLTYQLISEEPLVLVLPASHPQSHNQEVSLNDFANEDFIMPSFEVVPALNTLIYLGCKQVGFIPKVAQEAIWMTTILGLVAGEIGIALLPANVINLQRKGVVYCKIRESLPSFKLALVWRRDNQSKILLNFLKYFKTL